MHLRAPQHDRPVLPPSSHAHEEVRIVLLRRALHAVALGVGHCAAQHDVACLRHPHEVLKAEMVLRAVLLVDVESGGPCGIESVHTDTALETAACAPAQLPLHVRLPHEVVGGFAHMEEAAHAVAAEAQRSAQLGVVVRQPIGLGQRVDGGPHDRMVHKVVYELALDVDLEVPSPQGRYVALRGGDLGRPRLPRPASGRPSACGSGGVQQRL
mmetsp:Transcript_63948/g.169949  ORF Transcript_63948/g.169949 Transcript_63948/m.169949 type:complete len:212 (-) Transcript_63948:62-697(-)